MQPEHAAALDAFAPERFGFRRHQRGWIREFDGLGAVAVTALSWPHAQTPSFAYIDGQTVPTDALGLVVQLQQQVWGFPPELVVPTNVMAILPDSGGSVLVAYVLDVGFNADGWLGFVIGFGARSGTLVSHMLGVREELRGTKGIGWHLKLLQAYEALRTGHTAAAWTFDPMRGMNARLNLEKLAATAAELSIDKYGVLRSALYGENVPTDRLTAHWDLIAPATHQRIAQVATGTYPGLALSDVADVPEATAASLSALATNQPDRIRFRIPGDIDRLMRIDPPAAIRWRQEMRAVLSTFLTTKSMHVDDNGRGGPIAAGEQKQPGAYVITALATGPDATGERASYYVLTRQEHTSEGTA
ncbi:MAG: hypothetical protein ACRDJH_15525 [Thermomicrobiales bacterium]